MGPGPGAGAGGSGGVGAAAGPDGGFGAVVCVRGRAGDGGGADGRAVALALAGASSWGGAVLADTVNATSSFVNDPSTYPSIHPSKAVIASQDMCTVCKHPITPCWGWGGR